MLAGCKLEYTLDLLSINYRDIIESTFPTRTPGDERGKSPTNVTNSNLREGWKGQALPFSRAPTKRFIASSALPHDA